jgi:two-component system phosphate regulon sensor histidine kinase PhoR
MPLIVSGLFVLLLLVNNVIKNAYYDQTERSLESQTKIFKRILKNNPLEDFSYQKFCDKYGDVINARVTIIDKDGKVLGDSDKNPKQMDNHLLRPEIVEAVKFSVGTTKRFSETINEDFMYYAQKVLINNSYIFLRVSVPLNNMNSFTFHQLSLFKGTYKSN